MQRRLFEIWLLILGVVVWGNPQTRGDHISDETKPDPTRFDLSSRFKAKHYVEEESGRLFVEAADGGDRLSLCRIQTGLYHITQTS